MKKEYREELAFAIKYIKRAYWKYGRKEPKAKTFKNKFDLVTNIDIEIENYLSQKIRRHFIDDKVYGEETHNEKALKTKRYWVVDPIDGTNNMAGGLELYGCQIALVIDGKPVLGVIYLPKLHQLFYAIVGQGAYLNGKRLELHKTDIQEAMVSFGDYYHSHPKLAKKEHNVIWNVFPKINRIRMFGSAAIDFTYVATGKIAGNISFTRNIWDIAAGLIICYEAGAAISNLQGERWQIGDDGCIVANSNELISVLRKALKE